MLNTMFLYTVMPCSCVITSMPRTTSTPSTINNNLLDCEWRPTHYLLDHNCSITPHCFSTYCLDTCPTPPVNHVFGDECGCAASVNEGFCTSPVHCYHYLWESAPLYKRGSYQHSSFFFVHFPGDNIYLCCHIDNR